VLDFGTSNGAAGFLLERAGARFVVAVDVYPEDWFGFGPTRDFPGSEVEYIQGTVYEIGRLLGGRRFDLDALLGRPLPPPSPAARAGRGAIGASSGRPPEPRNRGR
jgi:hypothetical protein